MSAVLFAWMCRDQAEMREQERRRKAHRIRTLVKAAKNRDLKGQR